eukprot:TRINITY_DN8643_c0_g1_i1.p1 TRINITY_DN8643_c0_g1~~TRINITY_DN8643_c0_g1_i1.p1  ORF type:complete len:352 (+),score=104.08 TRINITY_DN8643_c0_g1_i1:336-1391(+)
MGKDNDAKKQKKGKKGMDITVDGVRTSVRMGDDLSDQLLPEGQDDQYETVSFDTLEEVDIGDIDDDSANPGVYPDTNLVMLESMGLTDKGEDTFYNNHVKTYINKGFISNFITFWIMVVGITMRLVVPDLIASRFVLAIGLFGFSGGITNWLAIKMLFDRIPGVYGSGIIPSKFVEIRETVKNVVLKTFFDAEFIRHYLSQKASQLATSMNLDERLKAILESPVVSEFIDAKLAELGSRPEGMWLTMMGINPASLKPMIRPFVLGIGSEMIPKLLNNFDVGSIVDVDLILTEIDTLMSTKLQELSPEVVKKLMELVMREHLGWLIVWGNVFGALLGLFTETLTVIHEQVIL